MSNRYFVFLQFALPLLLSLVCGGSFATVKQPPKPLKDFIFKSDKIRDHSKELDDKLHCHDQKEHHCLAIGAVQIGDHFDLLAGYLGKSWHSIPREDGSVDEIYPLTIYQDTTAYWVVSHKNNRVLAIQITGNRNPKIITFSGIHLGDNVDTIIERIGKPNHYRQYNSENAELWDYDPLPLTLEIYQDRLYSIRVEVPSISNISPSYRDRMTQLYNNHQQHNRDINPLKQTLNKNINTVDQNQAANGAKHHLITKGINQPKQPPLAAPQTLITDPVHVVTRDPVTEKAADLSLNPALNQSLPEVVNEAVKQTLTNPAIITAIDTAIDDAGYSGQQKIIVNVIQQWLAAWQQQDLTGFFALYDSKYMPITSSSRSRWVQQKSTEISQPRWIKLQAGAIEFNSEVNPNSGQKVEVQFPLRYQTPDSQTDNVKQLVFVYKNKQWLISDEK